MKKLYEILKIAAACVVGVFLGTSRYQCYDYQSRPWLYALTSTPWYYSIVIMGIFTVVVVAILFAVMWIIRKKM